MLLPSKHSQSGLSSQDQHRIIVTGTRAPHSSLLKHRVLSNSSTDPEDALLQEFRRIRGSGNARVLPFFELDNDVPMEPFEYESRQKRRLPSSLSVLLSKLRAIGGNVAFLVVDTNFLLSHLLLLDKLKDFGTTYKFVIIVPLEVVRELDNLKNSTKTVQHGAELSQLLGKLARMANDWIYTCLAEQCATVYGQTRHERMNELEVNDEAILDSSLFFQTNYPDTLHVLLSDDKNLCMRALLSGILTVSHRRGMDAERIAKMIHAENAERHKSPAESHLYATRTLPINTPSQLVEPPLATSLGLMQLDQMQIDQMQLDQKLDQMEIDYTMSHAGELDPELALPLVHSLKPSLEPPALHSLTHRQSLTNDHPLTHRHHSQTVEPTTPETAKTTQVVFDEVEKLVVSIVKRTVQEYEADLLMLKGYSEDRVTTLAAAAAAIVRFWDTIFKWKVLNCRPYTMEKLVRVPVLDRVPQTQEELHSFVEHWSYILHALYRKIMSENQLASLNVLVDRWTGLAKAAQR